MVITVYHQQRIEGQRMWDPILRKLDGESPPWPDQYKKVAVVDSGDLDVAWRLTNHIDSAWTDNKGVAPLNGTRHRSSMVGDVFKLVDATTGEAKLYLVEGAGFSELEVGE